MCGFFPFVIIYFIDCVVIKINKVQKYFFNAVLLSLAGILINTISVGFNIFVTNKVGAEGIGLITLSSGIYSFAITVATSGIQLTVIRLVSMVVPYEDNIPLDKSRNKSVAKIMKSALFYSLFFSISASFILFVFAVPIGKYALGSTKVIPSLKIMAFSLVPISVSSVLNGYFSAVRRIYKNVIARFFEQGVKISTVSYLLTLLSPSGIEYACASLALGATVSELFSMMISGILYIFDRRKHRNLTSDAKERIKEYSVFKEAFPIGVSGYVRSGLSTVEHLLIPYGFRKNGASEKSAFISYGILHGMVFPLLLFPSSVIGSFSSLLVPEISAFYERKDFSRIRYIVSRVFSSTLIFAFGVSGILICFSNEIGIFFYGTSEAGEFIRLLSPLIPLMYLDGTVDGILKGLGEQLYTMRVNILDSLVSVFLILLLLPPFGITGYVVVIFITELLNTSLSIIRLLNITKTKTNVIKWVVKPVICIVLSTAISRFVFNFGVFGFSLGKMTTVFEISFTAIVYLLLSYLTGSISNEEIGLVKKLVSKKKSKN